MPASKDAQISLVPRWITLLYITTPLSSSFTLAPRGDNLKNLVINQARTRDIHHDNGEKQYKCVRKAGEIDAESR